MKKKLEAELISIAHRILKLKNKSELIQLHQETQKLYEKLSILKFVEENFSDAKPTIGQAEIEEKLEISFFETTETEAHVEQTETKTEIEEVQISDKETIVQEQLPEIEEPILEDEINFKPTFELGVESKNEEVEEIKEVLATKTESTQITFEDLLGSNYSDPVFVKPEDLDVLKPIEKEILSDPNKEDHLDSSSIISINKNNSSKLISLNDRLSKGIIIGLNDRIAFINHLFANNSEDYNRVLSQLMTFDSFDNVKEFIDDMVKPDYNNWEGKEEYELRFMDIIEKKFN